MLPIGKAKPIFTKCWELNKILFIHSDDSLGYEFPFTLRAVSDGGRFCALCPWSKFCRGCEIPCNDLPLLEGMIPTSSKSRATFKSIRKLHGFQ